MRRTSDETSASEHHVSDRTLPRREPLMLRRVENVAVTHRPRLFGRSGPIFLRVGRSVFKTFDRLHVDDFAALWAQSDDWPVLFGIIGERQYWRFAGRWFVDNDGLSAEAVHALLVTRDQRRQTAINRAQTTVAMLSEPAPAVRGAIPDDLKMLIWARDGGRCRKCGSNSELQFDHIIPVSKGGATSEENLQLLCGPCNRSKGGNLV
ncbi:HNH endonuclease [Nocardia transvalensis]|uniref:HNH endonuclease n=1 Tax=Nocardia transvalensis TaxID=37333 RepID=UPI001E46C82F|nr:HNH endonuclease signature motif containing protein [Nocardia transvalensis]